MSSARGAAGANKPKLHNVNNVYSGKNNAASRATGPNRYGGLQSIGKASVVRRMPPPASLPSLKSECNGSSVSIIPAGSTGWNKATTTSDTSTDIKAAPVEANGSTSTSSTKVASITGSTDMRPDWAKSASQAEMTAEPQVQATSKTQSTDISAPASATAADESSDESSAPINLKMSSSSSGTGYIAATVRAPTVNRSLPSRYCGGYDEKASEKYRIAKRGMFKEDMIEGHSQEPPAQNKENDVASQREKEHKEDPDCVQA
uniref:BAT2_N domain-containing protein n=1 Tax=Steinernema glaseri TaxID=37863 RepID=A0A1I8A9M0_9BILA